MRHTSTISNDTTSFLYKLYFEVFNGNYSLKRPISVIENITGGHYSNLNDLQDSIELLTHNHDLAIDLRDLMERFWMGFGGFEDSLYKIINTYSDIAGL